MLLVFGYLSGCKLVLDVSELIKLKFLRLNRDSITEVESLFYRRPSILTPQHALTLPLVPYPDTWLRDAVGIQNIWYKI